METFGERVKKTTKKVIKIIIAAVVGISLIVLAFLYWGTYEDGVMAGKILRISQKGYVFKTYEGKLIQSGIRSLSPNTIQSYDFEFSVVNEKVAKTLMENFGKVFDLYYKEYNGALPWRGFKKYIVDSIVAMKDPGNGNIVR